MKMRSRMTVSVAGVTVALSLALAPVALVGSVLVLAAEQPPEPEPGTIITVAGSGPPGLEAVAIDGDGRPATQARLAFPWGVAVDAAGNLFMSDQWNHRVRKVSPDGLISTVAGRGRVGEAGGYSGDGGPATQARLNNPKGVAVDTAGNLYIADGDNHRVRKVTPDGLITSIAGNGNSGLAGDGGPATQARLNSPLGLALDKVGSLYIADGYNHRVRKVTPEGIITTVAGSGALQGGFSGDGGPATQARLNTPHSFALDALGNLYIADGHNHRVRKVDLNGTITTVAGSGPRGRDSGRFAGDGGPAIQAHLNQPIGLAMDIAGNLFIADVWNQRVRKVSLEGIITTVAGSGPVGVFQGGFAGDSGPATEARLQHPHHVAVDAGGNLFVVDAVNNRVRKVFQVAAPGLLAGLPFP